MKVTSLYKNTKSVKRTQVSTNITPSKSEKLRKMRTDEAW